MKAAFDTVYEKAYAIDRDMLDSKGRIKPVGLLQMMQDIAAEHAIKLGFGYNDMMRLDCFWVLLQQKLILESWPVKAREVIVKTWSLPARSYQAVRQFEFSDKNLKIGSCSTNWIILDTKSRRPKNLDGIKDQFHARTDYQLDFIASKVRIPNELQLVEEIVILPSDLDRNSHVNNVRYSEWALRILHGLNPDMAMKIKEYEINFLTETFVGDSIAIYSSMKQKTGFDSHIIYIAGMQRSSGKWAFSLKLETNPE